MWSYVEEDLVGMNILFKLWHILSLHPNGLRWHQIQRCFANQFGEILMFPQHSVYKREHWKYFIADKNEKYFIADPSISDGALLLIEVTDFDECSVALINEMVFKHFEIDKIKQLKYYFLDIVPLKNATIFDKTWKYILCFTKAFHANHFLKKHRTHHQNIKISK